MATIDPGLIPLLASRLYAPFFFSAVLCTAFYGATCMQTFFYYVHYQKDRLRIKYFVAALWLLNTVHEALTISGVYKYIMAGLVNPFSLQDANLDLLLQLFFTCVVAVTTQAFFVHRIYIFSGRSIIAPLAWGILELIRLVTSILYVAKAIHSSNGVQGIELSVLSDKSFMTLATLCLSVAAGIDILVAVFLTILLVRKQTTSGYSNTTHIMQRLVVFAVSTGILPAMFALLCVITLHLLPSTMIYAVFDIPLCPIYCNTLLANLNARVYLRGESTTRTPNVSADLPARSSLRVSENTRDQQPTEEAKMDSSAHQQAIWMTTEVVTFTDEATSENV